MSRSPLAVGKLPATALQAMLARLPQPDPSVLIGPALGEDAAVIDLGDRCLVVTTDPITFAVDRIGWYAVQVNANDVAVMGARPRWFSCVVLLPERTATEADVAAIMRDAQDACGHLGITVCGGHTEITAGLDRPIVVGQMLGVVDRERLACKRRIAVGDRVLLAQGAAIEGTAILSRERPGRLRERVPPDVLARTANWLFDPGISVVETACAAADAGVVHAMHDPTEGGIVTGLFELAAGSDLGIRALGDRIPVYPETRAVCDALGLDPLRLIASGALLIATPADSEGAITAALRTRGVTVSHVADIEPAESGRFLEMDGRRHPLVPADRDEIAKAFEQAP